MPMAKSKKPSKTETKRDENREERISIEIVMDAHDKERRFMGWYFYLEDKLNFPYQTRCINERAISPLRIGEDVQVVGMAPEDECEREMFVETLWKHKRTLAVPLSQVNMVHGDKATQQAVEDWHYRVEMGYEFLSSGITWTS